jgi:hypothetical protein
VSQLQLEAKISLGSIRGRIDHMAVDLARHRLFVAALGNCFGREEFRAGPGDMNLGTRCADSLLSGFCQSPSWAGEGCRTRTFTTDTPRPRGTLAPRPPRAKLAGP